MWSCAALGFTVRCFWQPVPKKKDEEPKNTSKYAWAQPLFVSMRCFYVHFMFNFCLRNRKKSRTKKPESAATHKKGLRQQPGRSISANVMYAFLFLLLLSGIGISYFFQGMLCIFLFLTSAKGCQVIVIKCTSIRANRYRQEITALLKFWILVGRAMPMLSWENRRRLPHRSKAGAARRYSLLDHSQFQPAHATRCACVSVSSLRQAYTPMPWNRSRVCSIKRSDGDVWFTGARRCGATSLVDDGRLAPEHRRLQWGLEPWSRFRIDFSLVSSRRWIQFWWSRGRKIRGSTQAWK